MGGSEGYDEGVGGVPDSGTGRTGPPSQPGVPSSPGSGRVVDPGGAGTPGGPSWTPEESAAYLSRVAEEQRARDVSAGREATGATSAIIGKVGVYPVTQEAGRYHAEEGGRVWEQGRERGEVYRARRWNEEMRRAREDFEAQFPLGGEYEFYVNADDPSGRTTRRIDRESARAQWAHGNPIQYSRRYPRPSDRPYYQDRGTGRGISFPEARPFKEGLHQVTSLPSYNDRQQRYYVPNMRPSQLRAIEREARGWYNWNGYKGPMREVNYSEAKYLEGKNTPIFTAPIHPKDTHGPAYKTASYQNPGRVTGALMGAFGTAISPAFYSKLARIERQTSVGDVRLTLKHGNKWVAVKAFAEGAGFAAATMVPLAALSRYPRLMYALKTAGTVSIGAETGVIIGTRDRSRAVRLGGFLAGSTMAYAGKGVVKTVRSGIKTGKGMITRTARGAYGRVKYQRNRIVEQGAYIDVQMPRSVTYRLKPKEIKFVKNILKVEARGHAQDILAELPRGQLDTAFRGRIPPRGPPLKIKYSLQSQGIRVDKPFTRTPQNIQAFSKLLAEGTNTIAIPGHRGATPVIIQAPTRYSSRLQWWLGDNEKGFVVLISKNKFKGYTRIQQQRIIRLLTNPRGELPQVRRQLVDMGLDVGQIRRTSQIGQSFKRFVREEYGGFPGQRQQYQQGQRQRQQWQRPEIGYTQIQKEINKMRGQYTRPLMRGRIALKGAVTRPLSRLDAIKRARDSTMDTHTDGDGARLTNKNIYAYLQIQRQHANQRISNINRAIVGQIDYLSVNEIQRIKNNINTFQGSLMRSGMANKQAVRQLQWSKQFLQQAARTRQRTTRNISYPRTPRTPGRGTPTYQPPHYQPPRYPRNPRQPREPKKPPRPPYLNLPSWRTKGKKKYRRKYGKKIRPKYRYQPSVLGILRGRRARGKNTYGGIGVRYPR